MTTASGRLTLLFLLLATTLAASRQGAHSHNPSDMASKHWTELIDSMNRMHVAVAALEPSESADDDFARLMLPHHQAAIDMARVELQHGTDPQMRRLAQEIIADQQSEIELMRLWLNK